MQRKIRSRMEIKHLKILAFRLSFDIISAACQFASFFLTVYECMKYDCILFIRRGSIGGLTEMQQDCAFVGGRRQKAIDRPNSDDDDEGKLACDCVVLYMDIFVPDGYV